MTHFRWLIANESKKMRHRNGLTGVTLTIAEKPDSKTIEKFWYRLIGKISSTVQKVLFFAWRLYFLFFQSVYTMFLVTLKPDCNNFNLQLFIVLCPSNHMINNNYDPIVRARDLRIINDPYWNFATRQKSEFDPIWPQWFGVEPNEKVR